MKLNRLAFILGCLLLATGCQTIPKSPATAAANPTPTPIASAADLPSGPDTVQATKDGFSPLAETPANNLQFEFHWKNPADVDSWTLRLFNESGALIREIVGTKPIPSTTWDGNNAEGTQADQGKYHAVLFTAGMDGVLTEKAHSGTFFLDIVPPSGSMDISPTPFQPGPAGEIVNPSSVATIKLNITTGGAAWSTWRLKIIHPNGTVFRGDFINEKYKDELISWDGRALNNARLEGGVTYDVEAEVFDIYGNKGILAGKLPVIAPASASAPSPMVVTLDGKKLADLTIFFPPFSADLDAVSLDRKAKNHASLDKLAEILKAATGDKVTIVGNANKIFYENKVKGDWEQENTLIPLSVARAEAVQKALVASGIAVDTLTTKGIGAANPMAPFDDVQNRWKNRRVDIDLQTVSN